MTDSKREQTLEELARNIIALSMCGLNQPLWETRQKVEIELLAYAAAVERRTAERAVLRALEQRCERGTPWDLAILAVVKSLRLEFNLENR